MSRLLPEQRIIKVAPGVVTNVVSKQGSLHIGEEVLVTLVTGTDEVKRVVRCQSE